MANRLLRNIAVKIGAGLATGFGLTLAARQPRRPARKFTPILTRLEDIESRVTRVEFAPSPPVPSPEEIEALGTLVSSQSQDIAGLQNEMYRIERRNAEQVEAFGQRMAEVEQRLPVHIEASINAKMTELEQKLRGEFQEIHHRTVDAFVETIENRVVGRIAALEHGLMEQSQSIISLREKSFKTDDNLQRLMDAVEKLCARAEAQAQIAVHPPAPAPDLRSEVPAAPEPVVAQAADLPVPPALPVDAIFESYQRPLARETAREPEPAVAVASVRLSPGQTRSGMASVGVAILGLAIIGFRLVR